MTTPERETGGEADPRANALARLQVEADLAAHERGEAHSAYDKAKTISEALCLQFEQSLDEAYAQQWYAKGKAEGYEQAIKDEAERKRSEQRSYRGENRTQYAILIAPVVGLAIFRELGPGVGLEARPDYAYVRHEYDKAISDDRTRQERLYPRLVQVTPLLGDDPPPTSLSDKPKETP